MNCGPKWYIIAHVIEPNDHNDAWQRLVDVSNSFHRRFYERLFVVQIWGGGLNRTPASAPARLQYEKGRHQDDIQIREGNTNWTQTRICVTVRLNEWITPFFSVGVEMIRSCRAEIVYFWIADRLSRVKCVSAFDVVEWNKWRIVWKNVPWRWWHSGFDYHFGWGRMRNWRLPRVRMTMFVLCDPPPQSV